ncbi:MAG: diguanylate cyclase [Gemmatimonadales bacterium]|nr:MAG: diguanylate cyclase [Gemmatimonadales bacterium]
MPILGFASTAGGAHDASPVPLRALGLSLLALAAPILGSVFAPDWMSQESGVLLWLSALIPPFLLTYYRGWMGASAALAAGMAALALGNVAAVALGLAIPEFRVLFWMVTTYVAVCIGIGLLAELLRREVAAAEAMALTDVLTQMPNRRHAAIFLDAAFASAVRGDPVSVVMVDLDRFKEVNDRHGHRAGDDVLRAFADALQVVTRRMDLSARWGGEEFLSILHHCTGEGAEIFLGRLRKEFETNRFPWGRVTFSAGIAQYAPGMKSAEAMLGAADEALYAAKGAGRDCHRIAAAPPVVSEIVPAGAPDPVVIVEGETERVRGVLFEGDEAAGVLLVDRGVPLPRGDEHLLVVDDDRDSRRALGKLLRRLGYRVVEAPDGESALASARSLERVDLLVTDLVMPGISGFSLTKRLQEERGPSRVLYISGRVQEEVEWASAPGAVQRYLHKPVGSAELAEAVRDILDAPIPRPVRSRGGESHPGPSASSLSTQPSPPTELP